VATAGKTTLSNTCSRLPPVQGISDWLNLCLALLCSGNTFNAPYYRIRWMNPLANGPRGHIVVHSGKDEEEAGGGGPPPDWHIVASGQWTIQHDTGFPCYFLAMEGTVPPQGCVYDDKIANNSTMGDQ
jgi:hypothetical protein